MNTENILKRLRIISEINEVIRKDDYETALIDIEFYINMKFITDDDGKELFNNLEKQANES
jgi:uncharacterized protein YlaN (UPF0358 family)